ncbi:hypothetical protein ABKY47_002045 [Aeromonas hydrophila]
MSIPSGMLRVIVSMMEASDGLYSSVTYNQEADSYSGVGACPGVTKLERSGIVTVIGVTPGALGDSLQVRLHDRPDFLSGFAAGVLAHRNEQDLYYADYNGSPFAFTCGWQHANARSKRGCVPYSEARGIVCHGFPCSDTNEVHKQP